MSGRPVFSRSGETPSISREGIFSGIARHLSLVMIFWLSFSGTSFPKEDHLGSVMEREESAIGENRSSGSEKGRSLRPFGCPDIAYTDLFRSKNLEYIHSQEFVDALYAVAKGDSHFSPYGPPPEWMDTAYHWGMHVLAHRMESFVPPAPGALDFPDGKRPERASLSSENGVFSRMRSVLAWERFRIEEESCSPFLVYRASLEYRSRPGNEEAGSVFPYYVRIGMGDLGEWIERFTVRAYRIEKKIARAERMGAIQCSPTALANARSELARARRQVDGSDYDIVEIEGAFDKADKAVTDLIRNRQLASYKRFVCFSR
jgi:hypothetical protein